MQATSQGWLVLRLTDSPALLGLVGAAAGAPTLLLAVFAGVLADRLDRRRLLAVGYWISGVLALVLAFLTTTGAIAYWHVLVLALLGGVIITIQMPAGQAVISSMVDRRLLGSAIALNSAQYNVGRIAGPSIAGLAIAAGGLAVGFWANGLMLIVVGWIISRLPITSSRSATRIQAAVWGDLQDGVRHVARDPLLRGLILLAAVPALLVLPYLTFLPVYARDILAIGAPGLGLLTGSIGVGALLGAILVATRRPGGAGGYVLLGGLLLIGLSLAVFAVSRTVLVSVLALAVLGASQVAYYSTTNTMLQLRVPARLRGRVHSLYVLTSIGLLPIANLGMGAVAERTGVPAVLEVGAVLTVAIALAAAIPRTIRASGTLVGQGSDDLDVPGLRAAEPGPDAGPPALTEGPSSPDGPPPSSPLGPEPSAP